MQPTRSDTMVFVYTLGTVITGWILATRVEIRSNVLLLMISSAAALAWTIYFRYTLLPRLETELTEEGDGDANSDTIPN